MQNQKMSVLEKAGFGAGDAALNVVISSMMLIITYFYTDIYGLRTQDLALLFVLVKIVGAVARSRTVSPAASAAIVLTCCGSRCRMA
jgi:GPH family glycoside/pentoside/hexuronide:cation symporter